MNQIVIKNLLVKREEKIILDNFNLEINQGEFVVVVGKSGSGKTTLLHTLAGLLPFSGEVVVPNNLGLVFQEYSVFPWLTVRNNIGFGLDKIKSIEKEKIIEKYLDLIELKHKQSVYPDELSGGQIQRVAIARSLAPGPEVLLMDEPFSSLDAITRDKMQEWLLGIQQKKQKTIIFVTHNIEEAVFLADRVLVLNDKKIIHEIKIDFCRPRDENIKFTEKFNQLKKEIINLLE